MTVQKKILVLVDGSERSERTVNYIKEFMPVDGNLKIVLFHVFRGMPEKYPTVDNHIPDDDCDRKWNTWKTGVKNRMLIGLEQMKKNLIIAGFPDHLIEINCHSMETGIARDIIAEAKNGYHAVIMSRRGTAMALQGIVLGSVAFKLLQSISFIPTLFVGSAPPVQKILLAVNTSASSKKAVDFLASMLGRHGSRYEICLIHVILHLGCVDFDDCGRDMSNMSPPELPDKCIESFKLEIQQLLQNTKDRLVASGFKAENISKKIVSGAISRSSTIVQEAENDGYSTIVVGRRGLSKVEAFFMGRVGHKVIHGGRKFSVWVV
jgi:nucleotide-binding universal stress UspA family protein